jgi:phosphoenolpyruvate synthase/pyruvate phosphate dikinase
MEKAAKKAEKALKKQAKKAEKAKAKQAKLAEKRAAKLEKDSQKEVKPEDAEKLAKKREKQEKKSKAKQIARENYNPKFIAGVSKGKDMSFAEADNGHVNPNYKKPNEEGYESGYAKNCQSCVVCLEMRRRGYNVKTKKYVGGVLSELGRHCSSAWLDNETGEIAVTTKLKAKNVKDLYSQLDNTMKEGGRYNLEFWWKGSDSGHIISMYKENGKIVWYDPQTNITYKEEALLEKLGTVSIRRQVEILRVDDKSFNPYYIDKIVEKSA